MAKVDNTIRDNEFLKLCQAFNLPQPRTEYQFCVGRKWAFDFCFLAPAKLALEVEGGVFTGGRHTSGAGFMKDVEKYNQAVLLGWRILRCTPDKLLKRETLVMLRTALYQTKI